MPSVYDYRHIELDRIGSGKKRLTQPVGYRGEDTQSRLFGGASPPESPRRLSTSSSGSSVRMSPGFLIKASQRQSNIFATDPVPTSPASSRNGSISNLPMSPGRLIKESQRRSNIFPQQPSSQQVSSLSSGASSTADLTATGNGHVVHMSPGRLIKASHQRSNIFAGINGMNGGMNGNETTGSSSRNSTSSASSSVADLASESETGSRSEHQSDLH